MLSTPMFARAKPYITNYLHVATFLASKAEQNFVFNHTTRNTIKEKFFTLLKILLFATSHYATGMQLVVVCNYLDHVCNYKFGIV
jgi:hypothetical protein